MNLDWKNLDFSYRQTNGYMQTEFAGGTWGELHMKTDPQISLHISANCLHYGQACFEGLKAFRTKDGRAVMFRPSLNAQRLIGSAERVSMQPVPEKLFIEACRLAVKKNLDFLPPYGTGASMYIRPVLLGTQAMIGVYPSDTYTFIVFVSPVGPYYKDGFFPVKALVIEEYDRAATRGTGRTKVAGNYAASMLPGAQAKRRGYPIVLYTDATEHRYIDEFGTSNFMGITAEGEYKTPDSPSILNSITNESLQVLAESYGFKVVKAKISLEELDGFTEVGACGTAAVITPIYSITRGEKTWTFGRSGQAGENLKKLYEHLQGIQYGEREDNHGWLVEV